MHIVNGLFLFFLGSSIGSFVGVLIVRIPGNISILHPASRCDSCGRKIGIIDNIPLISYILLNGKCRNCNAPIPITFFLLEIIIGFSYLVSYIFVGQGEVLFKFIILFPLLITISMIDLKTGLIPNQLTIAGAIFGIIICIFFNKCSAWESIKGMMMGGGVLFVILLLTNGKGMGMGDVKLAGMTGLYLGWQKTIVFLFTGFLSGAVIGLLLLLAGLKKRKDPIPFGPFLSFGAVCALFYGDFFISFYR